MDTLQGFLLIAPMLLLSFVAHEYAHAWTAVRAGDPTPELEGRLTWNPLRHIDPMMTVVIPIVLWFGSNGTFVFGGAKPVNVDTSKFKHVKRDDITVSLAGVTANVLLAACLAVLVVVLGLVGRVVPDITSSIALIQRMFLQGITINLFLCAFNLIPVPPLDGSHVAKYLLPAAWVPRYQRIGFVGFLVLVLFLRTGPGQSFLTAWLTPTTLVESAFVGVARDFVFATPPAT